jgi:hypothetical protein
MTLGVFFYKKVDANPESLNNYPLYNTPTKDIPKLRFFTEIGLDAVLKLILNARPSTCELDPIPSLIIKEHSDIFAPVQLYVRSSTHR